MKQIIATIGLAMLLATAGCMGGGTSTDTTTAMTTDASTPTAAPTSATTTAAPVETVEKAPSTEPTGAKSFQTGNKTGIASRTVSGDTFLFYYDEADEHALVKLADVSTPPLNESEVTPADYGYHEAANESETQAHKKAIVGYGYDAASAVENDLNRIGGAPTIVHTDRTTENGTPLVYVYFENDNGEKVMFNEYLLQQGMATLTNSDSPYADALQAAETTARENNVGLWAHDDANESNERSVY